MSSILDVVQKVLADSSISGIGIHLHQALSTQYEAKDEIRILVQNDLCTLHSENYLYVESTLLKPDGTVSTSKLSNMVSLSYLVKLVIN